jgi:sodium transport system permease protein
MLRVYRLDAREALGLRMPHPAAWVAALVGAPSALVVGLGIAQLGSYFFPVPEELLRQFGQELFPASVPLWQMLLFIAVLPGVCEEIAFRGMLLYGLKRRFGPVGLCLAVGVIFGLFHFSLFRLIGTAFLGVLLSAVTLLSGSIFPAMLWHFANNAIAVLAVTSGYGGEVPLWWSAAALVPLAFSFWLLWRFRHQSRSR